MNWSTNLLAVKWLDSTGNGTTSDLITALDWLSRRIPTTTPCLAAVCPSPRSPRGRDAHVVVVTNGD